MFLLSLAIVGVVWFAFAGHLALDGERIIAGKIKENDSLAPLFAEHVTRTIRGRGGTRRRSHAAFHS